MLYYYEALLLMKFREHEIQKQAEIRRLLYEARTRNKELNEKPGLLKKCRQITTDLFISLRTRLKKNTNRSKSSKNPDLICSGTKLLLR